MGKQKAGGHKAVTSKPPEMWRAPKAADIPENSEEAASVQGHYAALRERMEAWMRPIRRARYSAIARLERACANGTAAQVIEAVANLRAKQAALVSAKKQRRESYAEFHELYPNEDTSL